MDPERFEPRTFGWQFADGVGVVTLDRVERRNALTLESYTELRDTFRDLGGARSVRAVLLKGAGDHFCSGGDLRDIADLLTTMTMPALIDFTRMTGDLVKAMRGCPQPIVAAIDGVCMGAGAIMAMASDLRIATTRARTAFLFTKVGISGCDMGACAILPRIIGQGRAAELLYTGRVMTAEEGERWGFHNRVVAPEDLEGEAMTLASELAQGPSFAHSITKLQLSNEWAVGIDVAIEMEAQAQAICMQTEDFRRAHAAFAEKRTPVFEGN